MNEPHDDDLAALDQRAQAAARGLEAHVLDRVDAESSLHELTNARPDRRRGMAAAAVIVLLVASVAVVGTGSDDDRSRVDMDQLPDLEPGVLRPLGPRDGKDSIQLPVTVEPSAALRDGDEVTVSGTGFQPGERVGIVQCAREAGGETPEVRGGVDGCYVGGVQYADADSEGTVSSTFVVQRILTTPMTGTVDCAAEDDRCIVAIGALSDYDRSGGAAIRLLGGGEPLVVPEVGVAPTEALTDRQLVGVTGSGFRRGELLEVMVCSADPSGCWSTGEEVGPEPEDGRGVGQMLGLRADDTGHVDGEMPVWRYLPGAEPGTYIDCALSECSLRVVSQHVSPAPIPLAFTEGGVGPVAPSVAVDPSVDLAPGDVVIVRGAGFDAGSHLQVMLCAGPPGESAMLGSCTGEGDPDETVAEDGTFTVEFEIPDPQWMDVTETTACYDAACTGEAVEPVPVTCDQVTTECTIMVTGYVESSPMGPPTWSPTPVVVTFR